MTFYCPTTPLISMTTKVSTTTPLHIPPYSTHITVHQPTTSLCRETQAHLSCLRVTIFCTFQVHFNLMTNALFHFHESWKNTVFLVRVKDKVWEARDTEIILVKLLIGRSGISVSALLLRVYCSHFLLSSKMGVTWSQKLCRRSLTFARWELIHLVKVLFWTTSCSSETDTHISSHRDLIPRWNNHTSPAGLIPQIDKTFGWFWSLVFKQRCIFQDQTSKDEEGQRGCRWAWK